MEPLMLILIFKFQITLDRLDTNLSIQKKNQHLNSMNYGFTVIGYCPCQIGKIDKGLFSILQFRLKKQKIMYIFIIDSIADKAGLFSGDLILKINGKNVSRATCHSIVKIIKYVLKI